MLSDDDRGIECTHAPMIEVQLTSIEVYWHLDVSDLRDSQEHLQTLCNAKAEFH